MMRVGVLLLTHETMGAALDRDRAAHARPHRAADRQLAVPPGTTSTPRCATRPRRVRALDRGEGVLVLTDVYGATPSNVAEKLWRDSASTCAACRV